MNRMWLAKIDPDNSAIPYLTAIGDLIGTALLATAFAVVLSLEPDAVEHVVDATSAPTMSTTPMLSHL